MVDNKILPAKKSALLSVYYSEVSNEFISILDYWMTYAVDERQDGFYGSVSNDNFPNTAAPKGIVLNSRILWSFSAAFLYKKNQRYLQTAQRAYHYITNHFIDNEFGGVYWSVAYDGSMLESKKQIYGLAFCLYGVAEYYKASGNDSALQMASNLFKSIEQYSYDKENGGYLEAFTREWNEISDLRLSEKDNNEKKTMNTHLHVIEAYTNLYSITRDESLRQRIEELLGVFENYFINPANWHLNLFLDEKWNTKSSLISYGHDIEAAWLLLQCAEIIGNANYIDRYKNLSIKIINAAREGLDVDGGLWYEYEPKENLLIKEKHWWPQAEAMIGFMNAYELSGDEKYLGQSFNSWEFVKKSIKDKTNGEWFWGVDENNDAMKNKDKAGFWKCSYHNTRACLEIINRIDKQLKK
jgi:mannobiose 2-epimerase